MKRAVLDDLSRLENCLVDFGKYRGKTFKWVYENDLGYALKVALRDNCAEFTRYFEIMDYINQNKRPRLEAKQEFKEPIVLSSEDSILIDIPDSDAETICLLDSEDSHKENVILVKKENSDKTSEIIFIS